MDKTKIIKRLEQAIDLLYEKDKWLLDQNVNERSICHKLAEHLQKLYPDYNVDCEYNRHVLDKKRIIALKDRLKNITKLTAEQESLTADEPIPLSVFPDIIVHERGCNDKNKCIIEIKKYKSGAEDRALEFDRYKLELYTLADIEKGLNYQLGAFIIFPTGENSKREHVTIEYYQNGFAKSKDALKATK